MDGINKIVGAHEWDTVGQPGGLVTVRCRRCGAEFDPTLQGRGKEVEAEPCIVRKPRVAFLKFICTRDCELWGTTECFSCLSLSLMDFATKR